MSNRTDDQLDALISKAMEEVEARRIRALEEQGYAPFESSPRYRRFIARLAKKADHTRARTVRRRWTAALVAVLLIASLMSIGAVRKYVLGFFPTLVNDTLYIRFEQEVLQSAPKELEELYRLAYLPEGYEYVREEWHNGQKHTYWETADGRSISFAQLPLQEEFVFEDGIFEERVVSGIPVVYTKEESLHVYFWCYNNYAFTLTLSDDLSKEEVELILRSLTCIDPFALWY